MVYPKEERDRCFVEQVLPHERDLRGWLAHRFSAVEDIDDLVQETFKRVLKAYESGPVAHPRAFMFVTARNVALNQLRHLRYARPRDAQEIDQLSIIDEVNSPLETVAKKEELGCLIKSIQSLPKRCRQVMTLRKVYGFSQKEVARRLGISERTVETHVSIGLRRCSEYFREHGHLAQSKK